MADTFTTMTQVADEALAFFHNKMGLTAVSTKEYQSQFQNKAWDTGQTIKVRQPNNYLVSDGAVISSIPDTTERTVDLTLNYRKKVVMDFTTADLTFYTKHQARQRFIEPAVLALSNQVEKQVATDLVAAVTNYKGTAGTAPTTYGSLAQVKAFMNKMGIPEQQHFFFQEDNYADFISNSNLQNSFNTQINTDISKKYFLGELADLMVSHSIHLPVHTAGIGDSSATPSNGFVAAGNVKTTVTSGNTLVIENLQGSDTGVFLEGDKIKIAGVYSVNKIDPTMQTGELIEFTVLADANSTAGGEATITVSPTIDSAATSPYRNISNTAGIPGGAGSAVSLATANTGAGSTGKVPYKTNVGFHPNAILFAAPPLVIPKSVAGAAAGRSIDPDTGISIRFIEDYDVTNDRIITRMDILFAIKINPEYAIALLG